MKLFLTIETQVGAENLRLILNEVEKKLNFVTNDNIDLENTNNYGTEFRLIAIIPSCISKEWLEDLGWKERKLIQRKAKETDIRLHINYEEFIKATYERQREMYIQCIVDSIKVVQEKSKGDFQGDKLIQDIKEALDFK